MMNTRIKSIQNVTKIFASGIAAIIIVASNTLPVCAYDLSATPSAPDDFVLYYGGEPMNASTACEVLGGIHRAYGEDVAIDFAKNNWIPTRDWYEYYKQGGIEYAVQMIWGKLYKSYITGKPAY